MSINKKFKDLAVGDKFTLNGIEYSKITEVKISCCKRVNAQAVANDKNRLNVTPDTEVVVND